MLAILAALGALDDYARYNLFHPGESLQGKGGAASARFSAFGPLFVEGLGLDSIDALELALAIQEKFGVATSPDDERNREIFFSVKTLADFVRGATAGGPVPASDPA